MIGPRASASVRRVHYKRLYLVEPSLLKFKPVNRNDRLFGFSKRAIEDLLYRPHIIVRRKAPIGSVRRVPSTFYAQLYYLLDALVKAIDIQNPKILRTPYYA